MGWVDGGRRRGRWIVAVLGLLLRDGDRDGGRRRRRRRRRRNRMGLGCLGKGLLLGLVKSRGRRRWLVDGGAVEQRVHRRQLDVPWGDGRRIIH